MFPCNESLMFQTFESSIFRYIDIQVPLYRKYDLPTYRKFHVPIYRYIDISETPLSIYRYIGTTYERNSDPPHRGGHVVEGVSGVERAVLGVPNHRRGQVVEAAHIRHLLRDDESTKT